jgi:hypothetical protein
MRCSVDQMKMNLSPSVFDERTKSSCGSTTLADFVANFEKMFSWNSSNVG